ncbi:MAG TPA: RagB/SusD family nutrient uptake outer membrane protein [Cyclobacteriaceae bacterium]|nr:RagB/SusD family nutrient uptake outer membrane protein [Cyclobacteriaceae bacterium]
MKKLKYILFVLFISSACEDYLDRSPLDQPSSATFWSNEGELILAINGCYNTLTHTQTGPVPFFMIFDVMTDIGWNRSASSLTPIRLGVATTDNNEFLSIWRVLYQGISSTNLLLENMHRAEASTDPALFARIAAEARFLRAFYYFYLNELWGGVPLITTSLSLSESQTPRATKEAVTDFIIAELNEAAQVLPESYGASEVGRATKGAALTLLSRVALFNERWTVAAEASKQVMDLGVYRLFPDYLNLFYYENQDAEEVIFSQRFMRGLQVHTLPRRIGSRNGGGTSEIIPQLALMDSYECIDGLPIDESPLYDPLNPHLNRDPRLNHTLVMPGTNHWGFQFETHADSVVCWDYNTDPPQRIENQDVTNPFAGFSGVLIRKYADPSDRFDNANSTLNFIIMRYAEVLLNYAEAKIELNEIDASVYDAINQIRQRESVQMPVIEAGKTQEQMRAVVRKERKYELALEGLRFFDIRRWGIAEDVMQDNSYGRPKIPGTLNWLLEAPQIDQWGTPDYSNVSNKGDLRVLETRIFNENKHYLFPIPFQELEVNPNLQQNPNW